MSDLDDLESDGFGGDDKLAGAYGKPKGRKRPAICQGTQANDEGGDHAAGVATALKRTWVAAFKTGQSAPATLH